MFDILFYDTVLCIIGILFKVQYFSLVLKCIDVTSSDVKRSHAWVEFKSPEAEAKILAASPKPEDRSHPYEV